MKKQWTHDVRDSGDPLVPYQAVAISPSGKVEWVGNYSNRRKAELEGRADAERRSR